MSTPVKLYVYDLTNGLARSLSLQLTGRQLDGIWHTSVVVFGKEILYGQGIIVTSPGQSHHGRPLRVIDMGETAIDEETFTDYLEELREHYTVDKYHLLDFNCNSFTNDVVGFLTGGTIPDFIRDLPSDFLSTPLGAALRPTIDAMFRRPVPGQIHITPSQTQQNVRSAQALSVLESAATQVQASSSTTAGHHLTDTPLSPPHPLSSSSSITAPMHIVTNPASLHSFLKSHRAAAAFFTSQACPPCRQIEPVFERLAEEKGVHDGRQGVAFAKVDIDVGLGRNLAAEWNIRATPTFYFFLDGQKKAELKGADAAELKTQVDLLIYEAYPPHPHTRLSLPNVQKLSLNPILFTQVPPVEAMVSKLVSSIDEATWPATINPTSEQIKATILSSFAPYLKARFTSSPKTAPNGAAAQAANLASPLVSSTPTMLNACSEATGALINVLPTEALFPLVDMWRLTFLDPATGSWAAAAATTATSTSTTTALPSTSPCGCGGELISAFLPKAIQALRSGTSKGSRNYVLTVLRLVCNTFSSAALSRRILADGTRKRPELLTAVLVQSLLHDDGSVRTAAASLAFNVGAWLQNQRIEAVKGGRGSQANGVGEDEDWEVEMVSAIVEALGREIGNEEVVHRLTASLALFLRLSPFYGNQLKPLLEVLQAQEMLRGKLIKGDGWHGEGGVSKREIRRLIEEVAAKLCV